ncbi:DUF4279 domain-containing protein [Rhodocytophaga aerolata]|uniref:DUF4279 domain-containing protein n=1 Tax=Rhodocytophaga aerolata TaxID=455078 RepID=A0ABT8RH96_9BACT|nr:DUF4279 domain-containing protein [Rhodocytophaga aerolata]MDO1450160.1 DUF4279 domain-containing protein [Rhodocytophaga aerolata]
MTDSRIIQTAIEKIEHRRLGSTQQLLDIHDVVYEKNQPKVLRVDKDSFDGSAIVYFPILNEKFFLAVYLDTKPGIRVRDVSTEAYHTVFFSAISNTLTFEQLSSLTKLIPSKGWSKGDVANSGKSVHRNSGFHFEPNPEPDAFEDKLNKLLDALEQDKKGVLALANQADILIQVGSVFHNGNTMLGGHYLTKENVKRMAALALSIDFDLYAEGNFFKN